MFWVLCSDRNIGFGLSAIFTSAITSYLDEIGISDTEDRLYYLSMIRAMDLAYLNLHNERQKAESGTKKT